MSSIPDGFFVDESAIGFNAYSILKTGRDEYGKRLPLYFESFGEFKLPVYIYLTVPFIFLFGLNEFSVRFVECLASCLTILFTFLLARQLLVKKLGKEKAGLAALISSLFLAFEPWHFHFSRMAFGVNLALFFVVAGFYFLIKSKKTSEAVIGYSFLFLSFFTYHAPRVFVPLLSFGLLILSKNRKKYVLNLIISFLFIFLTLLTPTGLKRSKGVSIFHPFVRQGIEGEINEKMKVYKNFRLGRLLHNKPIEYSKRIFHQYLNHFSADFLFFKGDQFDLRFSIPFTGQLLLFESVFIPLGLYYLFKKKERIVALWLLLAPIPSSLSFQSPSTTRSILMMPAFQIAAACGLLYFYSGVKKKVKNRAVQKALFVLLSIGFIFNGVIFLDNYFIHQIYHKPYYWNYGFKQVALKVKNIESSYDKIIIGKEGTPYVHFLFFQKTDPSNIWQKIERLPRDKFGFRPASRIGKYYFYQSCPLEKPEERVLYICEEEVNEDNFIIIDKIDYKDGVLNFVLFEKRYED